MRHETKDEEEGLIAMLKESYSCDVCGTPEIDPECEVELHMALFKSGASGRRSTLHVCRDCSSRWSLSEELFDWLREQLKKN